MKSLIIFLKLIRVKQWIKNFFVLAPIIFSGRFMDPAAFNAALIAFISFCFIASGIYMINDLADIDRDKLHPKKCQRPLASGQVSKIVAIVLLAGFIASGMGLAFLLGREFSCLAGGYLILHGMYNFAGKRVVLMDIGCIAAGFCIRVWAGSVAIGVLPSGWLQMCVFVLALFLGFTKRRSEVVTLKGRSGEHREVLREYPLYFLDQLIMISATLVIVFYGLYTISPDIVNRVYGHIMVYSVGFVVYGIFRYLYLIHVKKRKEDADEVLLGDFPLAFNIVAWALFSFFILYR
ncbi:MAG: decaprenyl-phosphate phosphoribosyltransferase [Candidatus Omnitrophota bacterium]